MVRWRRRARGRRSSSDMLFSYEPFSAERVPSREPDPSKPRCMPKPTIRPPVICRGRPNQLVSPSTGHRGDVLRDAVASAENRNPAVVALQNVAMQPAAHNTSIEPGSGNEPFVDGMFRVLSLESARRRRNPQHTRSTSEKPTPRHFAEKFVLSHCNLPDQRAPSLPRNCDNHGHSKESAQM